MVLKSREWREKAAYGYLCLLSWDTLLSYSYRLVGLCGSCVESGVVSEGAYLSSGVFYWLLGVV